MIPGYIPGVVIYMIGGNPQSVSKMLFTIGPDFSELSRLPKWISDGVRDCFQNNPIISRKDTRLRLDQIPNEKRGFWKGRREWGYGKQLEKAWCLLIMYKFIYKLFILCYQFFDRRGASYSGAGKKHLLSLHGLTSHYSQSGYFFSLD